MIQTLKKYKTENGTIELAQEDNAYYVTGDISGIGFARKYYSYTECIRDFNLSCSR